MDVADRISADEVAYHERVLTAYKTAKAAWDSWGAHLVTKYGISLGDEITEDGRIVRGTPPATNTLPAVMANGQMG